MASRLNSILESSLRQVVGSVPLISIVTKERAHIMEQVRDIVNRQATGKKTELSDENNVPSSGFGVEVVDVRIMRADLPQENSQAIYRRMQTEREREAKEYRAQGAEEAQKIRSTAEKERTIIIANAKKKAEILRGEGDAVATKTFADASTVTRPS